MPEKVGIPRAMMFYRYYPLWSTFLRELGFEVVISPPTSKQIMERGILQTPEDTCLPVKVAVGHADWLKDKADFLFIPRLVHISKKYATCPKFLGLPDMIKAEIDALPPVLDPIFDAKKYSFAKTFMNLGKKFTHNPFKIKKAYKKAVLEQENFHQKIASGVEVLKALEFEENRIFRVERDDEKIQDFKSPLIPLSFRRVTRKKQISKGGNLTLPLEKGGRGDFRPSFTNSIPKAASEELNSLITVDKETTVVGVVGHPYNLYDRYTSVDLFKKLWNMDVRVLTPETLNHVDIENALQTIERPPYWELGRECVGSALHFLSGHADGVIHLISFECGPDSLLRALIEFENRARYNVPYMPLVLDEHTGEAGLVTRLEAFIDMLTRKPVTKEMVQL